MSRRLPGTRRFGRAEYKYRDRDRNADANAKTRSDNDSNADVSDRRTASCTQYDTDD